MSWKWPWLALLLMACGNGSDEHPPMLGDCMTCDQANVSAGGSSGVPEGGLQDSAINNAGDVGLPDALAIVDGFVVP